MSRKYISRLGEASTVLLQTILHRWKLIAALACVLYFLTWQFGVEAVRVVAISDMPLPHRVKQSILESKEKMDQPPLNKVVGFKGIPVFPCIIYVDQAWSLGPLYDEYKKTIYVWLPGFTLEVWVISLWQT